MKESKPFFQLKPHEEILETVRESLVPHTMKIVLLFVWFVLPFFFLFPLFQEGIFGVVIFFLVLCSAVVVILRTYFRWTRTVLVVTDMRIVDIDQNGFFDRTVTEATYQQIDEVNYRVKGFFSTIFRYGTIRVHVRGSAADIEFKHILRPARIHDLINDVREQHDQK